MAVPPEVRAGDLITADFMNLLLAELSDLKEQVALLQGGGDGSTGSGDLQGSMDVTFRDDVANPVPDPIIAGATASFAYRIRSHANLSAEFAISVATAPPTFQALAQVRNPNGTPIPGNRITLSPGASRDVVVQIPLPATSNGQTFSLNISAGAGIVVGGDARSFTVGAAAEPSDTTIDLSSPIFSAINPDTGAAVPEASYNLGTNTIQLPAGALGTMDFTANFSVEGTYDLTVQVAAGATGWTLTRSPTQHIETTSHESETVHFTIRPSATATTPTELTFRVQRQGATISQVRRYTVQRI